MKRIVIAVILLIITISMNFLSEKMINKYCQSVKKDLYKAVELIDSKDFKEAERIVRYTRNDKRLVPYIYNLDFKKIKSELDDAINLLTIEEYEYAKICILRSISLSNDVYEEYAFFHK